MKFGTLPLEDAEGAILAHSLSTATGSIKKGRVLAKADIAALSAAGHRTIVAARLEPGDIDENAAAFRVARAIAGFGVRVAEPFTGRSNLYADHAGLTDLDAGLITSLNRLDEGLTIATVPAFERVEAGQMIATVKVITFALSEAAVARVETHVEARVEAHTEAGTGVEQPILAVRRFSAHTAGLILTTLEATKPTVLAKRTRVISDRLESNGSRIGHTLTVGHTAAEVAGAIKDLAAAGCNPILVFAASAIVDRGDVIPAALVDAGGEVLHLGMPVDPGNLLMMGRLGDRDVIGIPSCAGSPKLNGFDWVLERRLAGLPVGRDEITAMGVGGLLKEIASRPQPREGQRKDAQSPGELGNQGRHAPVVAALVLAAGRSSRMGPRNKLLEPLRGEPLVRHAVKAALASSAQSVVVVTGHQAGDIEAALAGLDVTFVHNDDYALGLSTSVKAALNFVQSSVEGMIIALGDMPEIRPEHFDRLIAAFSPTEGRSIIVPVRGGRRGNPVLWGADFFREMREISGDTGARHLIGTHAERVVEIDFGTDAIFLDVDTPEVLTRLRDQPRAGSLGDRT